MKKADYEFISQFNKKYDSPTKKILRSLSENSRITTSKLAEDLELSRDTITSRLEKIEKEFGIHYTLELNEDAVGLSYPHLIFIKFRNEKKRPSDDVIISAFSRFAKTKVLNDVTQLIATIKGDYDLLVYANFPSRRDYIMWEKKMRGRLVKYDVIWEASEIGHKFRGFFPIRNELIENLKMNNDYLKMIKILNSDSRISFQEVQKEIKMHFNTVAYNLKKIDDLDYIKRFTIVMKPMKDVVLLTFMGKYTMSQNFGKDATQARQAFMNDDEESVLNRYLIISQLSGSYDFFALTAFDNIAEANKVIAYYKNSMTHEESIVRKGTIEKVLLGRLPLRTIDTRDYDPIDWDLEDT